MDLTVLKLYADVRYKTSLSLDRYTENITKHITEHQWKHKTEWETFLNQEVTKFRFSTSYNLVFHTCAVPEIT